MTEWASAYVAELVDVVNQGDVVPPVNIEPALTQMSKLAEVGAIDANRALQSGLLGQLVAKSAFVTRRSKAVQPAVVNEVLEILTTKGSPAAARLVRELGQPEADSLQKVRRSLKEVPSVVRQFAVLGIIASRRGLIGPFEDLDSFGREAVSRMYGNANLLSKHVRLTGTDWAHPSLLRLSAERIHELGEAEFDEVRDHSATIKFAVLMYPEAPARMLRSYLTGAIVLGGAAWRPRSRPATARALAEESDREDSYAAHIAEAQDRLARSTKSDL